MDVKNRNHSQINVSDFTHDGTGMWDASARAWQHTPRKLGGVAIETMQHDVIFWWRYGRLLLNAIEKLKTGKGPDHVEVPLGEEERNTHKFSTCAWLHRGVKGNDVGMCLVQVQTRKEGAVHRHSAGLTLHLLPRHVDMVHRVLKQFAKEVAKNREY